jgi:hypothetical protein
MTKLTKAQREVLEHGKDIYFRPITQRAHLVADGGFTIKVNISTFNALTFKGFIRYAEGGGAAQLFRITDAGRAALNAAAGEMK